MSRPNQRRQPRVAVQPTPNKKPKVAEPPVDLKQLQPAWRLRRMELIDPFGWHQLGRDKLLEIRMKLGHLETQTWHEILVAAKKQNHEVSIDKIAPRARKRLESLRLDDIDSIISLRLSGKERIWGILDNGVMMILWWDPAHQVCPSALRNT